MLHHPAFERTTYRDAILASKPLRYYRCGEGSGPVLRDLVGTADATISGTPTKRASNGAPGIADGAGFQTTNGGTGYATAGTAAAPTSALTLACWVFITANASPDAGIFGAWQGGLGGVMLYKPNNTTIVFLKESTSVASGAVTLSAWHFVAGTWDGSNSRIYIDGVLSGGPTANSTAPTAGATWCINTYPVAGNPATRILTGTTAECALWSRALSAGEIAHFNALGR